MELMFITNDTKMAKIAENAGIEIIFIDLEVNGKYERQGHLDTHIADHKMEDIGRIKKYLNTAKILARVNPYYNNTKNEINQCIEQGADIIMLPMFTTKDEVEKFIQMVDKRAEVCLLLETPQALVRINEIIELEGIDRIHVGLNDLHLAMGLNFMFELLSEGIVEYLGNIITDKGIRFGFGGIAKLGQGEVPAELILAEHYRLNSKMAILSRAFRNSTSSEDIKDSMTIEVRKIRNLENELLHWNKLDYEDNRLKLIKKVREIARKQHS